MESCEHRCLCSPAGEDGGELAVLRGSVQGAGEMAGISACPGWHLVQGRSVRGEGKRHARFAELDASFVFAFTALPVPGIENCDTAQPSPENMRLV